VYSNNEAPSPALLPGQRPRQSARTAKSYHRGTFIRTREDLKRYSSPGELNKWAVYFQTPFLSPLRHSNLDSNLSKLTVGSTSRPRCLSLRDISWCTKDQRREAGQGQVSQSLFHDTEFLHEATPKPACCPLPVNHSWPLGQVLQLL
jgi:hypothetical protein